MNNAGSWRVHVCNDYRIERCGSFMEWDRNPIRKLKGRRPGVHNVEGDRDSQAKLAFQFTCRRGYLHTVRGWFDRTKVGHEESLIRRNGNLMDHLIADLIASTPILPPERESNRKVQQDGLYACSLEAMKTAKWQRWYICGVPPPGKRGRPCWDIGSLSRVMGSQTSASLENAA